ncbi:MAG: LysE family transporter [Chloroflexota bacterium]
MEVAFTHGLVAGLGIAIPVGAIAVLIIESGRQWGFRVAIGAGLGAALADVTYAVVAVVVGLSVARALASHTALIHWTGAVVLGGIAVQTLLRALRDREQSAAMVAPPPRSRLILTFYGLTLANPLTITYFAALVAGEGRRLHGDTVTMFVAGVLVASLGWQTLLAAVGTFVGQQVPSQARRFTGILGGLIVAALALRLVLTG